MFCTSLFIYLSSYINNISGRALTTEEVLEASGLVSSEGISEMQRAVDDMERRLQDIAANAAATAEDLEADGMMDHDGLDMSRNAQNDD